jgi:hypothetical protein
MDTENEINTPTQDQPQPTQPEQTTPQKPAKKSNPIVTIIIVIAVLITLVMIGISVAGYFTVRYAKNTMEQITGMDYEELEQWVADMDDVEYVEQENQGRAPIPTTDAAGSNLVGMPLYPGSIRTGYTPGLFVGYMAPAPREVVVEFYETELEKLGYTVGVADWRPGEHMYWIDATMGNGFTADETGAIIQIDHWGFDNSSYEDDPTRSDVMIMMNPWVVE